MRFGFTKVRATEARARSLATLGLCVSSPLVRIPIFSLKIESVSAKLSMWTGHAAVRLSQVAVRKSRGSTHQVPCTTLSRPLPSRIFERQFIDSQFALSTRRKSPHYATSSDLSRCRADSTGKPQAELSSESVCEITKAWVHRFIIGQNICPFAAASMRQTNFVVRILGFAVGLIVTHSFSV